MNIIYHRDKQLSMSARAFLEVLRKQSARLRLTPLPHLDHKVDFLGRFPDLPFPSTSQTIPAKSAAAFPASGNRSTSRQSHRVLTIQAIKIINLPESEVYCMVAAANYGPAGYFNDSSHRIVRGEP